MWKFATSIIVAGSLFGDALAGDWEPRDVALKNLASGYAFMTLCSVNGHAQTGPVSRLGEAYQLRLTAGAYQKFRDQYQRSLHEKAIYSISKGAWMPFSATESECQTVDRSVDIYLKRLLNNFE